MHTRLALPLLATMTGCLAQPTDLALESASAPAVQQGVDRAGAFSTSEAMSLKSAYGISFTGVYIGGPCSAGSGWTTSGVKALADAVGWRFLPIFVGQQSSSICGRATLTEAQGITDGKSALSLMAGFEWAPDDHIPVALDLEAGSYSDSPSGAISYVKGFADTVSAGGYDVYVYSSVTALNVLAGQKLPITGAWPAYWLSNNGGFKSGLSPSQVPGLSSTWTSRAGAWQYNSGSSVVGGVDYDVADFPLAPKPGDTLPKPDAGGAPTDAGHHPGDAGARPADGSVSPVDAGERVDAGAADLSEPSAPGPGTTGAQSVSGCTLAGRGADSPAASAALLVGLAALCLGVRTRSRARRSC
jgi:hypothetical protein